MSLIKDGATPDTALNLGRKEESGSGNELIVVANVQTITSLVFLLEATHGLPTTVALCWALDTEASLLSLLFPLRQRRERSHEQSILSGMHCHDSQNLNRLT